MAFISVSRKRWNAIITKCVKGNLSYEGIIATVKKTLKVLEEE